MKKSGAKILLKNLLDRVTTQKSEIEVELNMSSLKLDPPPDKVRLCLDFGTAMSKATLVDEREDNEDIRVLKLGVQVNQEEISGDYMLVSSIYIDNNGLLWFGQKAVDWSERDSTHGRLDNMKRFLFEEGFDDEVNDDFNPTGLAITYGDMVRAYLMFLTWAVTKSLEVDGYPKNIKRRFAVPIFDGGKKRETIYQLKKMLGNAQILADTFYEKFQDGIPLSLFLTAVKKLDDMNNDYPFITEDITEPLGVAGSLLSWQEKVDPCLVMVLDVGAGTSDFSLFKIAYDPETEESETEESETKESETSVEVKDSARGITEAGNHLDDLLYSYIKKKGEITEEKPHYHKILGNLKPRIRAYKELLFNNKVVTVSLFKEEIEIEVVMEVKIKIDEFLALEGVKKFSKTLKDTMVDILEKIDKSWIQSARLPAGNLGIKVVLTGGGSKLPMVKKLAEGEISIQGNQLQLVKALDFPEWLDKEGYDEYKNIYPRVAVSLGGARRNIMRSLRHDSTAGDVKGTPILEGYYQKGN